jgi:hypothetical protein
MAGAGSAGLREEQGGNAVERLDTTLARSRREGGLKLRNQGDRLVQHLGMPINRRVWIHANSIMN